MKEMRVSVRKCDFLKSIHWFRNEILKNNNNRIQPTPCLTTLLKKCLLSLFDKTCQIKFI